MKLTTLVRDYVNKVTYLPSNDPNVYQVNPLIKSWRVLPKKFNRFKASHIINHGVTAFAVQLYDGNVLKIGQRQPKIQLPFYAPVLESGQIDSVPYIIQPLVAICTNKNDAKSFKQKLVPEFDFWDCDPRQIGTYEGKIVLVDYDAVKVIN